MSHYHTIGAILDIHAMIHGFVIKAVEDIPEARMTEQCGTIVNHPAWTLSHLNAYSGLLLSMLDDRSVPNADNEMELFGYGSTPVDQPALYASKPVLIEQFRMRGERLGAVVAEQHEEYFPKPAPAKYQPFSPTLGHIAITLLVAHPPHHLGQLRQWRRAAGLRAEA